MKLNRILLLISSILILLQYIFLPSIAHANYTFIKSKSNPLLKPGDYSWEKKHATFPTIIKDGTLYKMWYAAHDGNKFTIGYAYSTDGMQWTKNEKSVMFPSNDGWETAVSSPFVIKDGNQYKMWFTSINNNIPSIPAYSGLERYRIGYATSADGLSWSRKSNNVLGRTKTWSSEGVSAPTVIKDNGYYRMWFAGRDSKGEWSIGIATSANGKAWNQYENNPILKQSLNWEGNHVAGPSVIKLNNQLYMFYHGGPTIPMKIGYSTSLNGIDWTKNDNPLLNTGQQGSFDSTYIAHPSILSVGNQLWLYYAGHDGSNWSIGLATLDIATPTPSPTPTPFPTPTPTKKKKDVIVIVPGMFASFDPKAFATCSKTNWRNWKLIPQVSEYNGLIKTLQTADYTPNKDLFIFPYDWRQKITDSGKDLQKFINSEVRPKNPHNKIDLIGHSLGGLVSRSYLQEYDSSLVDQLITVGSPHHGVLEAYKPWGGGDLSIKNDTMHLAALLAKNVCKIKTLSLTAKEAIRKSTPVLRDILPTYSSFVFNNPEATYLRDNSTKLFISKKLMSEEQLLNTYLPKLNTGFADHFSSFDSITSTIKQMPLVYDVAGYFEDKIRGIYVLGRPVQTSLSQLPTDFGDGTVLKLSSTFVNDSFYDLPFDHRGMIYTAASIRKIVDILDVSPARIVSGQPTILRPSLLMLLRSPATISVTTPDKRTIASGEKFVLIPGFSEGDYEIKVSGEAVGDYELDIGQLTQRGDRWHNFTRTTKPNQKDIYKLRFNLAKPDFIPIVDDKVFIYLSSATQKIKKLRSSTHSHFLDQALQIIARINYLSNKHLNDLAAYHTRNLIRYFIYFQQTTTDAVVKHTVMKIIDNLESAFTIFAQNSSPKTLQASKYYAISQQYGGSAKTALTNNAKLNKATAIQAAAYQHGNTKIMNAKQALEDNEPYRSEIQAWTAFYLFKEVR